jgi:hypothetical protein
LEIYVLYIHDDRYSVPTIDSFVAKDDEEANQRAGERLHSSPHYFAIDLWRDERRVARLERGALPGHGDPSSSL